MAAPFDSEDLIRRSLFASIFGFRKQPAKADNSATEEQPGPSSSRQAQSFWQSNQADFVSSALQCPVVQQLLQRDSSFPSLPLRSKADIYREIVNECEEFERSTTASPLSCIGSSGPTSPTWAIGPASSTVLSRSAVAASTGHRSDTPLADQLTSSLSMGPSSVMPQGNSLVPEVMAGVPGELLHQLTPQATLPTPANNLPVDLKTLLPSYLTLEELVKYVVTAVKESTASAKKEDDPEEILRRKRQMNNEAAARYRRRQQEDRLKKSGELGLLQARNAELKRRVEEMQEEIRQLKRSFLAGSEETK